MAGAYFSFGPWPSLTGFLNLSRPRFRVSCCSHELSPCPLNEALTAIHDSGVIACLRAPSADLAMKAAHSALRGGISILEIVMSTPGVFEVVQQLVWDHPTAIIGVGTVLSPKDAKRAIRAGAKFLMSPAMVKDILNDVQCGKALYIPGAMTPTEILCAYIGGAKIVKVYPVSALGGVQYMSALKRSFPHIPMVASQGITCDLVEEYIAQGAASVVLSDAIFDKVAIDQQNFNAIYQLAHIAALQGSEAVKQKKMQTTH